MGRKRLGLIGNPLAHSWSPAIHRFLISEDYELWPMETGELEGFFRSKRFDGINVTIPYKSTVLRYLDEVDDTVARIQATNCIVNENGRLKGYNTDVTGMLRIIDHHGIHTCGGEAAILGSGGASKAAEEVCRIKGWKCRIVSRTPSGGQIGYDELAGMKDRITVIINTTPVGMHPHTDCMPVDPADFPELKYLIDVVANPIRTTLTYEAERLGIRAYGGLEMLVAQALAADELFLQTSLNNSLIDECMSELISSRRNIVLTGMPSAGKTTIGRMLAERLGREFCDIDEMIVRRTGMQITDYFALNGEAAFRDLETGICREMQDKQGAVIATGGGVIKNPYNMRTLAHSGLIVWLDRDPAELTPTDSRPLSSNMDDLLRLYEERRPLYAKWSDIRIDNNAGPEEAAETILEYLK